MFLISTLPLIWGLDYFIRSEKVCVPVLAASLVALFLIARRGFGKYCEFRADKEILKRAYNPLMLETEAEAFSELQARIDDYRKHESEHGSGWRKLKAKILCRFPWLDELLDEHPRSSVRAAYFERAHKKMIEKEKNAGASQA